MSVAIVTFKTSGGVNTIFRNLLLSLYRDGFRIRIYRLDKMLPLSLIRDIANISSMKECDTVIYMGSIPKPSALFLGKLNITKLLFIHGFIYHELFRKLLSPLKEGSLKNLLKTLVSLSMYEVTRILNSIDYYVCHSITACNMTGIPPNKHVILPQFLIDEDLSFYESLRSHYSKRDTIRIVTYGSYAPSPRLLTSRHMIALGRFLKKIITKNLKSLW